VLCSFFWASPRRLNFMWRRFGTLLTQCSETSPYKIQTRGITQTKEYNIRKKAKVLNQESILYVGREYFRRKQVHEFGILENCYCFLPPTWIWIFPIQYGKN